MIAIPLPFVTSLLLSILAVVLFYRREQAAQATFIFIALCAVTSSIVGFRWETDIAVFKVLQPVLASCIPGVAWYCFTKSHRYKKSYFIHCLPPMLVVIGSLTYPFWRPPLDPFLAVLYVAYGIALLKASLSSNGIPEKVRLSDFPNTQKAESYAGIMLIVSAVIDIFVGINFAFYSGANALNIIAIGYCITLPLLAGTVVVVSQSVVQENIEMDSNEESTSRLMVEMKVSYPSVLTEEEMKKIVSKIDLLITEKEVFLDPDLTLDRLARKSGIPAKQISTSINQVYGRNISQVINEYRIERAKQLLISTDKTITQIYFDSGFQTKSNFNREFTRITEQTPSAYRSSQQDGK
ncbi:AraC family transcriptional regulator [Marinomonas sp. S3726]|uniref:helix-turn-helix domain-containing protein n=1 Tax=Marinomonas sp. S3726 TaxID=579484 RepID=UPI0005F9EBF4|nr:helix-turn-helix domain-containing protein [Marinomonas sp. S3726]KJZ16042.1 AraC family transcriptional regulator [Marinomonas sp. S3726]